MSKGYFITFEGGEGVGKTTQIERLETSLKEQGIDVVRTREPGGTEHAEIIRNLLSDPKLGPTWSHEAELMMFSAARAMHVRDLIKPALDAGKTVICDRYTDSTMVYQGFLQNQPLEYLNMLIDRSTKGVLPDLTLILDLPAEESIKRVKERGARDHYDEQDVEFYKQLRTGFLSVAEKNKERCVIIDAMQPVDDIAAEILKIAQERMPHV